MWVVNFIIFWSNKQYVNKQKSKLTELIKSIAKRKEKVKTKMQPGKKVVGVEQKMKCLK